jgi:hypothetical protein
MNFIPEHSFIACSHDCHPFPKKGGNPTAMVFFHQVAGKGEAKYSDFSDLLDPERRKSFLVQTEPVKVAKWGHVAVA